MLVPFEILYKAEAAFTNGPVDQDYRVALERHRSVFEEIARRKLHEGAIEPDGTSRVTLSDLSQLGH